MGPSLHASLLLLKSMMRHYTTFHHCVLCAGLGDSYRYNLGELILLVCSIRDSLQSAVLQRTAAQRDRWRAEITVDGVPDHVYL